MNLFEKILEALGFGRETAKPAGAPKAGTAANARIGRAPVPTYPKGAAPVVDVTAKLDALAAKNPQKLNWKRSIVDLLKLLDIDSSYEARRELATELGCPAEAMGDSAAMNTWLHKTVMKKLAENGGRVQRELLD